MNAPTTFHVEELTSTNDRALELARLGEGTGTAVSATRQTAGRGRMGRRWETPAGSLAISVIHRPSRPVEETASLTPCVAVALVEGLHELGVKAEIKWPNDLRINGRKVCGILCELHELSAAQRVVIVGVGLNVAVSEFPPELDAIATSLSEHGCNTPLSDVADILLNHVRRALVRHDRGGDVPAAYETMLEGVGGQVQWNDQGCARQGTLVGVRLRDGALHVTSSQGDTFLTSGELSLLGNIDEDQPTKGAS